MTYDNPAYYSTSGSGYPNYTTSGNLFYTNWPAGESTVSLHTTERNDTVSLTIKSVQLKAGWVGQLWNGANIVWESKPKKTQEKATMAASKARTNAIARLFEDN